MNYKGWGVKMNWYKNNFYNVKIAMNAAQFIRSLRNFNVVKDPKNYKKLINLDNGQTTIAHDWHRGEDIALGTQKSILRQLGIPYKDYIQNRGKNKKQNDAPVEKPVQTEQPQEKSEYIPPKPKWKLEQEKYEEMAKQMANQVAASVKYNNWYKKARKWKDHLPGGRADGKTPQDYEKSQVEKGHLIEFEHTDDPDIAREIAMDHLEEHKEYYTGLENMENMLTDIEKRQKKK